MTRGCSSPPRGLRLARRGRSCAASSRWVRDPAGLGLLDRVALRRDDVPDPVERLAPDLARFRVPGRRAEAAVEGVERVVVVRHLPDASSTFRDAEFLAV